MIKPTIADTGAIVGFLNRQDQWHEWTVEQWRQLRAPFLTCEAVIVEACFLMKNSPSGKQDVLSLIEAGVLQIDFSLSAEASEIKSLITKYESVPMDFADACLVRMSELIADSVIFTVDGDFRIYRKNRRKEIPLIIPDKI